MPNGHYKYLKKHVLAAPTEFIDFFRERVHKINKKCMIGGFEVFAKATNLQLWIVDMGTETVKERTWREMLNEIE